MRKAPVILAAAASGLLLAASTAAAAPALSDAIAGCGKADLALQKAGTLTVGTDNPAYPPWFAGGEIKGSKWKINDPATGKGYESAVAYEIAKRLGLKKSEVAWTVVPFTKSFAPGKKTFDVFIN